jgi:hypothetical protein
MSWDAHTLPTFFRTRWQSVLALFTGLVTCILTGVVAAGMRNDHADCYEYLRMSERLFVDGASVTRGRPPLLPLLQGPLWLLGGKTTVWVWAHLLQVVLVGATGALAFITFRRWIGTAAGAGVALLFLDRVFIHFAPSAMTDHLAVAALLLSNLLWERGVRGGGAVAAVLVGLSTGVLMQAKYVLGLVPLSLVIAGTASRGWRTKVIYVLGVVCGVITIRGIIEGMGGQPLAGVPAALLQAHLQGASGAYVGQFSWSKVLLPVRFLVESASPGLVVAFLVGVWIAGRRHRALVTQFVLVMVTLCFVLGEKEARYLLPVLPIVYAFAALGLRSLWSLARRSGVPIFGAVVVGAFLVQPLAGAVREWREHLRAEVNRYPADAIARRIGGELRSDGRVLWRGGAYPLYRSRRVRMPGDDYYGVVRLGPAGVSFWLGQPCAVERRTVPILEGPLEVRRARAFVDRHRDGDVVLVAPPRGTEQGSLELVSLSIVELHRQGASSLQGFLAEHRKTASKDSGDIDYGYALGYCGGEPRAVNLDVTDVDVCAEVEALAGVVVTRMQVTRLVP